MNTKTKHTPGPWTVHAAIESAIARDITESGLYEIEEANEHIVGLIEEEAFDKARAVAAANRRLIAAAPELLGLAEYLAHLDIEDDNVMALGLDGAVIEARALIKKARGES